jgi:DNA polymerase elongation subunit (family B)
VCSSDLIPESELFNWVESNTKTGHKNWDGKNIKKLKTEGRYLSQFRIQELIHQLLNKDELDKIYSIDFSPRKSFLDIEITLTSDEFPDPEKAEMPVGLITFCTDSNQVYVLSTLTQKENGLPLDQSDILNIEKEVSEYLTGTDVSSFKDKEALINLFNQNFKIQHKFFEKEEEMLSFFFHNVLPKLYFITGWNVIEFDWKYLMNRARRLKIEATSTLKTPSVYSKAKIPTHLGLLDYMVTFEKLKPYKVVENYKLDYISNLVLGVSKLKHGYPNFYEFQKDTYLYTKYNIIDTILVKLIEDKLGILEVAFSIAGVAQIEVNKVFSPVYISEIMICREFLTTGLKMMKLPYDTNINSSGKYEGAYVMSPIPGYYNYVSCYDFSSMYPNIQIQWNISPDTYLGKNIQVNKKDKNIIWTKNSTYFTNTKDSVSRKILTSLYDQRMETQAEIARLYEQLEKIK